MRICLVQFSFIIFCSDSVVERSMGVDRHINGIFSTYNMCMIVLLTYIFDVVCFCPIPTIRLLFWHSGCLKVSL